MKLSDALRSHKLLFIIPAVIVIAVTLLIYSFTNRSIRPDALHVAAVDASTLSAHIASRLETTLTQRVAGCSDAQVLEIRSSMLEPYIDSGYTDCADLEEMIFKEITLQSGDIAFIGSNLIPVFAERGYILPLSEQQTSLLGEETRKLTSASLPDGNTACFGAVIDMRPLTDSGDVYYGPKNDEDPSKDVYICVMRVSGSSHPELADAAMNYFCENYR